MVEHGYKERYQAFIRNSSEGIWLCELDEPIDISLKPSEQIKLMFKHGYMAECNDAMAKMYGLDSRLDLDGARLKDLLIESDPKNTEYLKAFIKAGYKLNGVESHERDAAGNLKIFRNSLIGVIENGKVLRAWGTQQDVTETYLANEELKASQERLSLALQVTGMGLWEWNMVDQKLTWSFELKRLFGLKPKDEITYEKYLELLHPDDRDRMETVIKSAIDSGQEYEVEHRIIRPDGTTHWMLGYGKAFYSGGKPVRMLGTTISMEDSRRRTELEVLNRQLLKQKQQLQRINIAKDEFISLASHQLRTPATAVKQYIGILLDGYVGQLDDEQRKILERADFNNERQLSIINDLLRVARVDAGKVNLTKEIFDLVAFLQSIISDQHDKFRAKHQTIKLFCKAEAMLINADRQRLRMALENIIDNASKYSPEKSAIKVRLLQTGDKTTIEIVDRGVGIDKKDLARLFKKFSRIEAPGNLISGNGLGLYWAKKIVALHGGKISVKSTPGKGSTFVITI